jgi:chemotaxis protein methyltransferase CheR
MVDKCLPNLMKSRRFLARGTVNIWSAACSTGEEPYTLAMVLADYFAGHTGDYCILASDISHEVLAKARKAIYSKECTNTIPTAMKYKYLMRGTGSQNGKYRIVPELRKKITFTHMNLMNRNFNVCTPMDMIFCRNVIIYFDKETNIRLMKRFYEHLAPGGYLFIGHSETLTGVNSQFRLVAPTIYQRDE